MYMWTYIPSQISNFVHGGKKRMRVVQGHKAPFHNRLPKMLRLENHMYVHYEYKEENLRGDSNKMEWNKDDVVAVEVVSFYQTPFRANYGKCEIGEQKKF